MIISSKLATHKHGERKEKPMYDVPSGRFPFPNPFPTQHTSQARHCMHIGLLDSFSHLHSCWHLSCMHLHVAQCACVRACDTCVCVCAGTVVGCLHKVHCGQAAVKCLSCSERVIAVRGVFRPTSLPVLWPPSFPLSLTALRGCLCFRREMLLIIIY